MTPAGQQDKSICVEFCSCDSNCHMGEVPFPASGTIGHNAKWIYTFKVRLSEQPCKVMLAVEGDRRGRFGRELRLQPFEGDPNIWLDTVDVNVKLVLRAR